jgi:hypothetical protein
MLRRHICESRTSELDDIFPKLVGIDNKNIVEKIKAKLKPDLPTDKLFEDKFAKYSHRGNEERAKYILESIEYELIGDKGEYILGPGSELWLEHIIPQTINTKRAKAELGDWVKYLGTNALEYHKEYLHLIGNYTLIAGELNIKAKNNPFVAKLNAYKESNIKMTLQIVKDYKEFRFKEAENRSKDLAKMAVKIWKF